MAANVLLRAPEVDIEAKQAFSDFLDQESGPYRAQVNALAARNKHRLLIDIAALRKFDENLARRLLRFPAKYVPAFHAALQEFVARVVSLDPEQRKQQQQSHQQHADEWFIGLCGNFGAYQLSPRSLSASFLRSLVCVEGIATKCSLVRPKVVRSVHYCPATGKRMYRDYRDATSVTILGAPTPTAYPTRDENDNPLSTEFGLSIYKDHQMVCIQEMPERAPAGQLPRSVEILLDEDLVDVCKPGDRIRVYGVYRALPSAANGQASSFFRTVLITNNVELLEASHSATTMTEEDVANIHRVNGPRIFEGLANSIAPSLHGHEWIKKSILLMLLGGVEKNLDNGTHLRGDINMLLVGDPGTGKSQLLRFVLSVAPLAINTTGKGASGVGLTAAVTVDKETGERVLEAGAMVLADRGIVCIDEFDKMSEDDRVAIHEVMEQQTVTISKAGIHTSLNARCSVLAAANPVYGEYDARKKPTENIGLPDSLLSRFDLLFIVLDAKSDSIDRAISKHVLRMHRYKDGGVGDDATATALSASATSSSATGATGGDDNGGTSQVLSQYNALLHGGSASRTPYTLAFLKKYISYAKAHFTPILTDEAVVMLTAAYRDLRSRNNTQTAPVTPRSLETMIRLATAHAKCRLRNEVTQEDARVALELMNFALYSDTGGHTTHADDAATPSTRTDVEADRDREDTIAPEESGHRHDDGDDDDDDDDEDDERLLRLPPGRKPILGKRSRASTSSSMSSAPPAQRRRLRADSTAIPPAPSSPPFLATTSTASSSSSSSASSSSASASSAVPPKIGEISAARVSAFRKDLVVYMKKRRMTECSIEAADSEINLKSAQPFNRAELEFVLQQMEDENLVMYRAGSIHII